MVLQFFFMTALNSDVCSMSRDSLMFVIKLGISDEAKRGSVQVLAAVVMKFSCFRIYNNFRSKDF